MRTWIPFLIGWALSAPAFATTLRTHVDFSSQWKDGAWQGDFWREPGKPKVPVNRLTVLLPYGEDLVSARFETSAEQPADGRAFRELAAKPRSICGGGWSEPREWSAALPVRYPAERLAANTRVITQHGYRFVQASVFPLLLNTATGDASRVDQGDLVIETRQTSPSPLYRGLAQDRAQVTANYLASSGRYDTAQSDRLATYPLRRAATAATMDYLVIAPQTFIDDAEPDSLNRLLFEKNGRGVRASALAVETIQTKYSGADIQAKIRAAITDYYKNRGIQYVLLVGNGYSSTPTRTLTVTLSDMNGTLPSDYYFACLDGTMTESNPDLACEVAVGRAPVTSLDDMHVFVRKSITMQELDADDPRLGNEMNMGEWLDPTTLGGPIVDQVLTGGHAGTLSTLGYPSGVAVRKMYEQTQNALGQSQVIDAFNNGQFYTVNHIGHADEAMCMHVYTNAFSQIQNDIPFFAFTQGCHPGNISVPNWASKLVTLPSGGAGAIIANSNYGFYAGQGSTDGPSNRMMLAFYDAYFRDGLSTLGKIHFQAKQKIAPQVQDDKTMLWVIFETNLLGDPELELKIPRH